MRSEWGRGDGRGPEGGGEGEAVGERGGSVCGLGGRERKKRNTGTDEGRGHGWRRDLMGRRDGNEGRRGMRDQGPVPGQPGRLASLIRWSDLGRFPRDEGEG